MLSKFKCFIEFELVKIIAEKSLKFIFIFYFFILINGKCETA